MATVYQGLTLCPYMPVRAVAWYPRYPGPHQSATFLCDKSGDPHHDQYEANAPKRRHVGRDDRRDPSPRVAMNDLSRRVDFV